MSESQGARLMKMNMITDGPKSVNLNLPSSNYPNSGFSYGASGGSGNGYSHISAGVGYKHSLSPKASVEASVSGTQFNVGNSSHYSGSVGTGFSYNFLGGK